MPNLIPASTFDSVPELETATLALGGPGGPMNLPLQALLNRTQWLHDNAVAGSAGPYASDTGTSNAYTASFTPPITSAADGLKLRFAAATANTGAATFAPNAVAAAPIIGQAGLALQGGEIAVDGEVEVTWSSALGAWVMTGCSGAAVQVADGTASHHAVSKFQLDAVSAVANAAAPSSDLASTAMGKGGTLVGFIQSFVGATARTMQDKAREVVSVFDFMTSAQITDVRSGALTQDVTAAIQAAITAQASSTRAGSLYFPDGNYLVSSTLVVPAGASLSMRAMSRSCARITKNTTGDILQGGAVKVEGIDFFHNGATGSSVTSTGDNLSLFGCGFVPGSSNTSPMVTLGHANHNVDGCVFVGSNAAQWCVDVVANTGNNCINGRIGNQTTMYGNSNGARLRTGTGGRPEGWDINAKIIVTGAASVEVIDCLSCKISGVLDQASAYGVKLSPPTSGRIDGLHIVDAYIATATAPTTGTGIGASNAVVGGITGLLVSRNHIQLCGYGVVLDKTMVGARCSHNDIEQITTNSIKYNGAIAVSIDHNYLSGTNAILSLADGTTGSQVSVVGNSLDANGTVTYTPTNPAAFEFSANVGKKFSGFSSASLGASSGTSAFVNVPHGLAVTPSLTKITGGVLQGTGAHQSTGFRIVSANATNVTCEVYFAVVTAGTLNMNLFCSA